MARNVQDLKVGESGDGRRNGARESIGAKSSMGGRDQ